MTPLPPLAEELPRTPALALPRAVEPRTPSPEDVLAPVMVTALVLVSESGAATLSNEPAMVMPLPAV